MIESVKGRSNNWSAVGTGISDLYYHFQPIINCHSGNVFGYECLLRGIENYGTGTIGGFFDKAFQEGNLLPITLDLLALAMEGHKILSRNGKKYLFYNLDNRLFSLEMPWTRSPLPQLSKEDNTLLYFELSEKHPLVPTHKIKALFKMFNELNWNIAIDDFGAGYSGLQLLYRTEPDIIKIDQFFIRNIHSDYKKKLFVENLINMAHTMGVKVIAEGIETQEEFFTISEIGCDFAQGYYIAKPCSAADLNLKKYDHIILSRQRESDNARLTAEEIGTLVTYIKPVTADTDGLSVLKRFQKDKKLKILPIIDREGRPIGVISDRTLKHYVFSPYGIAIYQKNIAEKGLGPFIEKLPLAEKTMPLGNILKLTTTFKDSEAVMLTKNGRYFGILDNKALIRLISERELLLARELNPLTKLPGNFTITQYLVSILNEGKSKLIVYFDFDHFKPFNDTYGFRNGDRIIILFSEILQKKVNLTKHFIGHIGGDDFILIFDLEYIVEVEAEKTIYEIRMIFQEDVLSYYSQEDREKQCIRSFDRTGGATEFPLLTVSAAGLMLSGTENETTLDDLNLVLAKLKKKAKLQGQIISSMGDFR